MKQTTNSKAIRVPCTRDNFYKIWLTFLMPLHKLTTKSTEVASELLRHRYLLSKAISDPVLLNKVLMGQETRTEIMKKCNITSSNFYVVMGKLKKADFLKDGGINPKFIPDSVMNSNSYQLHIMFNVKDEENIQQGS